jgi:hypothetical protein
MGRRLLPWLLLAAAACRSSASGKAPGAPADTGAGDAEGSPADTRASDTLAPDTHAADGSLDLPPPADAPPPDAPPADAPPADAPPVDSGALPITCGSIGSPCPTPNQSCSVGDSVEIACREFRSCRGLWETPQSFLAPCQAGTANACPVAPPGDGSSCPVRYQLCGYPTGTTCGCVTGCERGADAGPCNKPLGWVCRSVSGGTSCPPGPPALGTPCGSMAALCTYGPTCSAFTVQCTDHGWQLPLYGALGGCG